ncbi:MAG: Hemolysin-type calcium-binding region [Rhodocyclaceae bacterium]|nr:MAG: Hemolysin-type calcium-binding region [Rhodocyclaceae bacterium]
MATQYEIDCALMAGRAYQTTRDSINWVPIPVGWVEFFHVPSPAFPSTSGFEAISFQRGTGSNQEIVISFAGTNPVDVGGDVAADVGLAMGLGSIQLREAAEYYLNVRQVNPDAVISFTGHSLGGGLAALMGVFFDRPAVTFDQAPFAASANAIAGGGGVYVDLLAHLRSLDYAESLLQPLRDYPGLADRAGQVRGRYVQGEFLTAYPAIGSLSGIGTQTPLTHGANNVSGIDLHSQTLLTAFLQNDSFRDVTTKLSDLGKMLFDSNLYYNDPNILENAERNFLENLVRHQAGNINGVAFDGDKMLDRFTADLQAVAQDGGLTLTNNFITKALIAFAMQMYYEKVTVENKHLFDTVSMGGGLHFDQNDIADTLSAAKGGVHFRNYLYTTFTDEEQMLINSLLPVLRDWYVQAGATGMNVTDTQNRNAFLLGGNGSDTLTGGSGTDLLIGNAGVDTLEGAGGSDILIGGNGEDRLMGGDDNDILDGGKEGDFLYGDGGDDRLKGGEGDDKLFGGDNADVLEGQSGDDILDGGKGNDILKGGDNNDILLGHENDDDLYGDAGNDTLVGGEGTDTLDGGEGNDDLYAGDPGDSSDSSVNKLNGGAGDDKLYGAAGQDLLEGGTGNDILIGGDGADELFGGENDDTLYAGTESTTDNSDTTANQLIGGTGNDTLNGGGGQDLLLGGDGDDTLSSGARDEVMKGGIGSDTYLYAGASDGYDSIEDRAEGKQQLGNIRYAGATLSGGTRPKDDTNYQWKNDDGVTYSTSGDPDKGETTLTISNGNGRLTVKKFINGDLGIQLKDKDKEDEPFVPPDIERSVEAIDPGNRDYKRAKTWSAPRDPLVIDLDGNGARATPTWAGTYFDYDGDGTQTRSGWVAQNDALLVRDRNGNGSIDTQSELYGDQTLNPNGTLARSGFAALAGEDGNHDGRIDAQDAAWNELKLWQDRNNDGQTQADELSTPAQHDIVAFNTAATNHYVGFGGSTNQLRSGTYTKADGSTGAIGEMQFEQNPVDTRPAQPVTVDTPTLAALPNLKGSGKVQSLWQAMSLGTQEAQALADVVGRFDAATTRAEQLTLLDEVLTAWADTSGMTKTLDERANGYAVEYLGLGTDQRSRHAVTPTTAGTPTNGRVRNVDDPHLDAAYRAKIAEFTRVMHVAEAFNGEYFYNAPGAASDTRGANDGMGVYWGGSAYNLNLSHDGRPVVSLSLNGAQIDPLYGTGCKP